MQLFNGRFLVDTFREKMKIMADSYSDPFFLFFLQTTDLTMKGPLFTETTKTTKLLDQPSLASGNLVHRVPLFWIFQKNVLGIF